MEPGKDLTMMLRVITRLNTEIAAILLGGWVGRLLLGQLGEILAAVEFGLDGFDCGFKVNRPIARNKVMVHASTCDIFEMKMLDVLCKPWNSTGRIIAHTIRMADIKVASNHR